MFLQEMAHEGQTFLQEFEFGSFDHTKLGILNMASIEGVKATVRLAEIINPRTF